MTLSGLNPNQRLALWAALLRPSGTAIFQRIMPFSLVEYG